VTRLLVATSNPGKLGEFRRLLAGLDAGLVSPTEIGLDLDVPEPFDTYAENAAAKASTYAAASGLVTVADDSGIEVAALGWGPGPRSARHGTTDGLTGPQRVVADLAGVEDRRARMVCALALARPGAAGVVIAEGVFEGIVEGRIATKPRGDGGFGYDPIFELFDERTSAELTNAEKDRHSHRGRAVAAAWPRLVELTRP
jgi:XTP/dITP diphosphohydrolase